MAEPGVRGRPWSQCGADPHRIVCSVGVVKRYASGKESPSAQFQGDDA